MTQEWPAATRQPAKMVITFELSIWRGDVIAKLCEVMSGSGVEYAPVEGGAVPGLLRQACRFLGCSASVRFAVKVSDDQ